MMNYSQDNNEIDSLRAINRSKILNLLHKRGSLARNQLAEIVGLTPASVTRIVNECIEAGLIIENKYESSVNSAGRRPIPLSLNPSNYCVCGVNIGKFWIDIGLMNLAGDVLSYSRNDRPDQASDALQMIKSSISGFELEYDAIILTIGVTLYGQVDVQNGTILEQNVLGWSNIPLREKIEEEIGIKTVMDTNIYSMAFTEYAAHPLPADQAFLFVSIGSTVGIGIVVNNIVIRGKQGIAGFLEHFPWFAESPYCECGKSGCVTAVLSDSSLLRQAREIHPDLHIQNINDLIDYSKTYPLILNLLKERAQKAGEFIAKLAAIHDPGRIVIDGSLLMDSYQQIEWVQSSFNQFIDLMDANYASLETPNKRQSNVPFTLIGAGGIAINKSISPSLMLKDNDHPDSNEKKVAYIPL